MLSLHSYEQKPFLRQYMNENRLARKRYQELGDDVGSENTKLSMNGCYGGFGVNPKRPILKVYQDYSEEAKEFEKNNRKLNPKENAWVVNEEQINNLYNVRFEKELTTIKRKKEIGLLNDKEYKLAKETLKKNYLERAEDHKKYVKSLHTKKNIDLKKSLQDVKEKSK